MALLDITSVELPCFFSDKNKEEIYNLFGGVQSLERVKNGLQSNVELTFRPDDPHSRPVVASICKKPRLLISMRKNGTTSIVGRIKRLYHFTEMADFQLVSKTSDVRETLSKENPDIGSLRFRQIEHIPTTLITRQKRPLSYNFDDQERTAQRKKIMIEENESKSDEGNENLEEDKSNSTVKVEEKLETFVNGELVPWQAASTRRRRKRCDTKALERKIHFMFSERAVWATQSIRSKLSNVENRYFRIAEIFKKFATWQKNGPFRNCWMRSKYSPATDPESAELQSISIRTPSSFDAKKLIIPEDKKLFYGQKVGKLSCFQMIDLAKSSKVIRDAIKRSRLRKYNEKTGWFDKKTIKDITGLLKYELNMHIKDIKSKRQGPLTHKIQVKAVSSSSSSNASLVATKIPAATGSLAQIPEVDAFHVIGDGTSSEEDFESEDEELTSGSR
eukprot:g456.t1